MKIPHEEDWRNDYGDLDVAAARRNFFGLNLEQAEQLFRNNALRYQEDIAFMPFACFQYYVEAYLSYLLSDASKGDSDGASCFFGLIDCRKSDIMLLSTETKSKIRRVLERLAQGQEYFDAPIDIYKSFRKRAEKALKQIEEN